MRLYLQHLPAVGSSHSDTARIDVSLLYCILHEGLHPVRLHLQDLPAVDSSSDSDAARVDVSLLHDALHEGLHLVERVLGQVVGEVHQEHQVHAVRR